jgi:hypothetical protein
MEPCIVLAVHRDDAAFRNKAATGADSVAAVPVQTLVKLSQVLHLGRSLQASAAIKDLEETASAGQIEH